ncbi:MAG: pyridoxal 5'-phosphate synthase glutaminase subunit PdxT [Myxococcota bacterium]|nr:pyridoxal 5'-phosphate synthase glutaminase subunit PdxT [Myxococcota bacterium]
MLIGVLALQGGYAAHAKALEESGHTTLEVREAHQLSHIEGLVLPGGESTTQLKLIDRFELEAPLRAFIESGKPTLATCAGVILCASEVEQPAQRSFGWLDIAVHRNGYGRQLDSFEGFADDGELPLCFIRAPRITRVGSDVQILATLGQEPVLVQQGNVIGATFHPELTDDRRIYRALFKP